MKISALDPVTGKFGDIVVHRPLAHGRSIVDLGDRVIGEVWGPDRHDGWTAVSHAQRPHLFGLRTVTGFRTRWQAVQYLLKVGVYLPQNYCVPDIDHHAPGYCGAFEPGKCHLG